MCIHPGWAPLRTRAKVIASWADILGGDGAPEPSKPGDAESLQAGKDRLQQMRKRRNRTP